MTDDSSRRLDDRQQPETSGADGATPAPGGFVPPHPGSRKMPRWNAGELIDAPRFSRRHWYAFLGPGLVAGASAIGGGEWLLGPLVTARYGGALLWLATLSILAQGLYNIEVSRYTLYTGEPIFTGKFRTLPGPQFWLLVYLVLDFGTVFPYLAATAATPVMILLLGGEMPAPDSVPLHWWMHKFTATAILVASIVPLIFGGKVYNSLKAVMSFKLVAVFGFLLILAVFYSRPSTWLDIGTGFFKFGTVPVLSGEDRNGNGRLDPGEDWDGDGHLDVVERRLEPTVDSDGDGRPDTWERGPQGRLVKHEDLDGDGYPDGANVENVFVAWFGKGGAAHRRFHPDRLYRRHGRHCGQRRLGQYHGQQLHPRPGLGHGTPCGRHSQHGGGEGDQLVSRGNRFRGGPALPDSLAAVVPSCIA